MIYFLALGSNQGDREALLHQAIRLIDERCGKVEAISSMYHSMPVGYESDHEYINMCLRMRSDLSPIEILDLTQQIEREMGRTIKNHYADRTIDIDLLAMYQEADTSYLHTIPYADDRLIMPHPRMHERDFVMVPLSEINH